jgi:predicted N-acetyltransferase YhbS
MDVSIRLADEADLVAADRMFCAAYERTASVLAHLRLHRQIEPAMFWVAEDDGRIVGTAGGIDYGAIAYVGMMAVDPAWQRRGIARRLLAEVLRAIDARGCQTVLLDATEKGAPLYATFGFVDDGTARVFEYEAQGAEARGRHSAAAEIEKNDVRHGVPDLREMVGFDQRAFGACREKLLAALVEQHRPRCLTAHSSDGELAGYLFARDPILGPWAARDTQIAEALLSEALALEFASRPQVMVPPSNNAAAELLLRHGFAERRSLRHMRRGVATRAGRPGWMYGQSSFAHG